MNFKSIATSLGLTLLCACASPGGGDYFYKFPKVEAPDHWQGAAGLTFPTSEIAVKEGMAGKGDTLISANLEHVRTAILDEDFTYGVGPRIGKTLLTLPKGSPLYAQQFTYKKVRYHTYAFNDEYIQSDDKNPIEWCAPAPDGQGSVCLHWQTEEYVYVQSDRNGSPLFPGIVKNPTGDKRPLPRFHEAPASFDKDLLLVLELKKIGRKPLP